MSTLVDRLIPLRARLGGLPVKLGVPQYQGKVVLQTDTGYLPIEPNPKVDRVSPKGTSAYFAAGTYLVGDVQILGDELIVSGVPRSYSLEVLQESIWIVDAIQQPNGTWTGTRCNPKWTNQNETTTWQVILTPRKTK